MTQDLTAPSIMALFETNKEQRSAFVQKFVEAMEEGQVNPLDAHLQLKAMEDIINSLLTKDPAKNKLNHQYASIYMDAVMSEAEKHGKSFELHQSKISIGEAGVKYDFSICNDPEWDDLNSQIEVLKGQIKDRETFLKTVPYKGLELVTEEGEVLTIYPPKKTSTTVLKVTLR